MAALAAARTGVRAWQAARHASGGALPLVDARRRVVLCPVKPPAVSSSLLFHPASPCPCPGTRAPHPTPPHPTFSPLLTFSLDMSVSKSENGDAHRLDPELAVSWGGVLGAWERIGGR